jgi:alkaline phosphatase D
MYSWGDADIFLTDDRWWRSADNMKDSVEGKPNPEKRMLGKQQMEWLKNSLVYSMATFKIIVVGSQVYNPVSPFDKWQEFPAEYNEMMDFLKENKINGVLFLSGDRHHSEIIKQERPGTYPLYHITVSPFTSATHKFFGAEANNPHRVFGLDEKQNYARISITGKRNERKLTVDYRGVQGDKLGEWSVSEKDLKMPITRNQ